jgi:ABC-type lipoprotein export system ATPase subunit
MKLSSVRIKNLFGQFDYNIELNQEEGITILTGPNGYGKTTILNIIWGLFNRSLNYIHSVPFKEINLSLDNGQTIRVKSGEEPISALEPLENVKGYFIEDQRLTYAVATKFDGTFKFDGTIKADGVAVLNTIDRFSRNLAEHISRIKSEEDKLALNLADSFPDRLLQYAQPLPDDVFEKRFEALSQKQQRLRKYGIVPGIFAKSEYKGDNRRVLSVYLEDYERKTSLYDDLLRKLDLFLAILNEKQLVNKTISIQSGTGFCLTNSDGNPLQLSALSSGEQNEIILLYELLFNAPPDSLVLIDEPETSMHVAWQIEFLQDIEKIAKLSGLSFIIATHSPDLINDKIDLCVDLFENTRRANNHGE